MRKLRGGRAEADDEAHSVFLDELNVFGSVLGSHTLIQIFLAPPFLMPHALIVAAFEEVVCEAARTVRAVLEMGLGAGRVQIEILASCTAGNDDCLIDGHFLPLSSDATVAASCIC